MIGSFIRFDLTSWLPRRQTLLLLGFVAVVGILLPVPGMAIMGAAIVTSLMIAAPFLGDERGRLDTLYGILPVSRSTVVVGRAGSIVVFALLASAIAFAVTLLMAGVRGASLDWGLLLVIQAVAVAFVGLSASIQLPVLFRIGYTRGRLISYAPALAIAGLAWLAQAIGVLDGVQEAATGVPLPLAVGLGLALGATGIVVGVLVAVPLYRKREL
ncbi:hypothetical protein A4X17_09755 [Plantibacter sp. H53]|uniref:ABC-2 transporter permease n=1 Tax=Plantibacter sp. H53 TaxID=1827323 RepID=UPI0007D986A9|nr:ABC-2 transporter permease [Plantibacter sp. H53]OAN26853.1 hypothetical protein A4X17_09755 [Plantibacter sp. H53]